MNYYLTKIHQLLKRKNLEGLILYSNPYNDRYLRALTETNSILQNYIYVSANQSIVTTPIYLVADLKEKTKFKVLASTAESTVFEPILKLIANKRVGYAGQTPYQDLFQLKTKPINLTAEVNQILSYKSDCFIQKTNRLAKKTTQFMAKIDINGLKNVLDIQQQIKLFAANHNLELSFPPAITSHLDLKQTTAMLPKNQIISKKEIICLDMGFKNKITMTDRTRMYFKNQAKAKKIYQDFSQIHWDIIQSELELGMSFANVISLYQKKVKKMLNYKILQDDFGHGIGFSLHEKPFLETSNSKIKPNQIFTLEPTLLTPYGKMRIEDMVGVLSDGKIINLTKK